MCVCGRGADRRGGGRGNCGQDVSEKNKTEKQREYQNTPPSLKWIHFVNKTSQQEKQPNSFPGYFYQAFEEEIMTSFDSSVFKFLFVGFLFFRKEAPRINAVLKELACVLQAASVWSGRKCKLP